MLTLHIARMDARANEDGELSDHASRQYLAWSNSLTRTLRTLGLDETAPKTAPDAAPTAQDRPQTGAGLPSGRLKAGRRLQALRRSLSAHVGGKPSAVQSGIIDQILIMSHAQAEADPADAAAMAKTITALLRDLGIEPAPILVPKRSHSEWLAGLTHGEERRED